MSGRRAVALLTAVLCLMGALAGGGIASVSAEGSPSGHDPAAVALAHVAAQRAAYRLSATDVDELVVSDVVPALRDAHVVYLQQRHHGLDVYNGISNVVVGADGSVITVASRFVGNMAGIAPAATPALREVDAVARAAAALGLTPTATFEGRGSAAGAERAGSVSDGGVSTDEIPVRLVYQPLDDGGVALAWDVQISTTDLQNVWQVRIDAGSGAELDRNNLVAHEGDPVGGGSYRAYPEPVEAPSFGGRALVSDPADATASPFGWHDTNGAAGAESTLTLGNNVTSYTDINNDNLPDAGSQPNGGAGLAFDFTLDLAQQPSTYRPAAVTNLFYWNNYIHDVFYGYGFNEVSGNFQTNNYGNGGAGNDAVRAEAQDGGGINNANFLTLADGAAPRMQMYNWNLTAPSRDGDLDNGVIVHEYGHGISNRLTGGPANVGCLSNAEQGGEGWSDWFALMLTMDPLLEGENGRGIGTYVLGQPTTGNGIRTFPYSTSMVINPHTYNSIKTLTVPHGVGSVWAAMLWEVSWAMMGQHGFDPDLIGGTGGNNMALQLIVDGLKLQPCSPGFVNARDAILLADQNVYAGAHQCLLWTAFAKRGLGFSATQGSSNSVTDGTQAFDLPVACSTPAPDVTGFTPGAVPQRKTVTILGTGFTGATVVAFAKAGGGTVNASSFTVTDATHISAVVPALATTGVVSVTTPGGTDASPGSLMILPAVRQLSPTSGPVGTTVTITGSAFTGASAVSFNGVPAAFAVISDTSITATVPAGATTGRIRITNPGGSVRSKTVFTVT